MVNNAHQYNFLNYIDIVYMVKIFLISIHLLLESSLAREPKPLLSQTNKLETDTYMDFKEIVKTEISYTYDSRGNGVISVNLDKNKNIVSKTSYETRVNKQTFIFNDNCRLRECLQYIHD